MLFYNTLMNIKKYSDNFFRTNEEKNHGYMLNSLNMTFSSEF